MVGDIANQRRVWTNKRIKLIAVSPATEKYLREGYGAIADAMILNAVDTDKYVPIEHTNKKPLIIHGANDDNKSAGSRLSEIAEILRPDFDFEFLNITGKTQNEKPHRMAMADIFIQNSRYEGNSYLALEAMSCNLTIVASEAGLFEDTDFGFPVAEILPWDDTPEAYAEAIRKAWANKEKYSPRKWILENATIELFKNRMYKFLSEVIDEWNRNK